MKKMHKFSMENGKVVYDSCFISYFSLHDYYWNCSCVVRLSARALNSSCTRHTLMTGVGNADCGMNSAVFKKRKEN